VNTRATNSQAAAEALQMRRLLVVLGVPIDDLTMAEALDRLEMFIRQGRQTGKSHQVATVNADFVIKSLGDPELRYLLQDADMATADGMPLVWGARLLGVPLAGRVTGADMVPALAKRAAEKGYSLFLLGAGPGVAARAAQVLQEQNPGLKIAGVLSPPYGSVLEMSPQVAEEIRKADPDVLLVAFGNPKQEKWIGMYGRDLGVPVMIGVGGTLDFIAGSMRRAPQWMQRLGLEWLYRLLQEPRRLWRRYVVDLLGFSAFFARQWWAMRGRRPPVALLPFSALVLLDQGQGQQVALVSVEGHLDVQYNEQFKQLCSKALAATPHVIVNMERARFVDSSIVGTLVALAKQADEAGGELRLAAVPDNIRRTLTMLRLERFFIIDDSVDQALAQAPPAKEDPLLQRAGVWSVWRTPRRVDATTSPALLEQGNALLAENGFLILDFEETDFLTSAGLAVLVQLQRRAQEQGGALRLVVKNQDVLRVLKLVRFDRVFEIFDSLAEASAASLGEQALPNQEKERPA
jgi:N-acetylglucosaminyldiphosphoundecaprenol N-acetyl-beta-D-mannosaminyltransferase